MYIGVIITNEPRDTTLCINATAQCACGFTGVNPYHVIPNWKIVSRSDNGSIISTITYDGVDIVHRPIKGLQWLPDLTSGDKNASYSKLLVGPVSKTHNQSSYQCFIRSTSGSIMSSIGTMTVVGEEMVAI